MMTIKKNISYLIFLISLTFLSNAIAQEFSGDPTENFKSLASSIPTESIESLPLHDRGRMKPFHTFARETILFISGKYSFLKLDPIQVYLGLIISPANQHLEIINIRDVEVREKLGYTKSKRHFSINQIERSGLAGMVAPLLEKERQNKRLLEPKEKALLEAYSQFRFLRYITSGNHFLEGLDFKSLTNESKSHVSGSETLELGKAYLRSLASQNMAEAERASKKLLQATEKAPLPELFQPQRKKMNIEVFYNKSRLFFISAILLLFFGLALFFKQTRPFFEKKLGTALIAVPLILLSIGFGMRVYITGFAPVTNMYGTMIWVSLGVVLFSLILLYLYKNYIVTGSLWIGAAGVLILTESIPIILSPDLDPIVAVLRSNLWLTVHVLTIVISYAAFTITMILSNIVLIRSIIKSDFKNKIYKEYSQTIYRMIQLGVFLLSVGIILGGVWADYSWGRFWGWDPKETWALIADIGYLAILHARYIGWLGPFGVIAASPVAYLLVIMAWYGVNFILAAGLHSYGFSSGGATLVAIFVSLQLIVLFAALGNRWLRNRPLAN